MNFTKITKPKARAVYNAGGNVYLMASKLRVGNAWVQPVCINKNSGEEFESQINAFSYYNCNAETGKAVNYYLAD